MKRFRVVPRRVICASIVGYNRFFTIISFEIGTLFPEMLKNQNKVMQQSCQYHWCVNRSCHDAHFWVPRDCNFTTKSQSLFKFFHPHEFQRHLIKTEVAISHENWRGYAVQKGEKEFLAVKGAINPQSKFYLTGLQAHLGFQKIYNRHAYFCLGFILWWPWR